MRGPTRPMAKRTFLAVEGILYLWFLWGDLGDRQTKWVKYLSVLLCFLFALWGAVRSGRGWIPAAQAFALAADAFLLLADRWYPLGVAMFCGAHLCWRAELRRNGAGWAAVPWWAAGAGILAWLLAEDLGAAAAAVYAVLLVSNVLWARGMKYSGGELLFAGLALLLCCDLCVAVRNVPGLFPTWLHGMAQMGMWLFYLPSQVCIALYAQPESERRRKA